MPGSRVRARAVMSWPARARPAAALGVARGFARVRRAGTGDITRYAAQDAVYRMAWFVPAWSHHGVTRGWRPVMSDPYTRAVLATSALFRRQSPTNLSTGWRVWAGSNGGDARRVRWSNRLPSSML